jgi:hypothetical protein
VTRQAAAQSPLSANDKLFRDLQPDRDVHGYYSGMVQYENGVVVNIRHSWIAGAKFHGEYTRLAGARGMVDFNTGVISLPSPPAEGRPRGLSRRRKHQQYAARLAGVFQRRTVKMAEILR